MIDDTIPPTVKAFRQIVWEFYHSRGRHDLPWRQLPVDSSAAYQILVSEVMLQQTQVTRVIPKYQEFLRCFPTIDRLAAAPAGDVLRAWNGLGYNRRAKFLQQAARTICQEYDGRFPDGINELIELPGIGVNTAGAIRVYAFNQSAVFVETNIRTIFIHHYFHDQTAVPDKLILELVVKTLDPEHPREWYWALMDYGAWLKQSVGNLSRHSKSYTRQSKFEGSRRQLRGQIIRLLSTNSLTFTQLEKTLNDARLAAVLEELAAEQLIRQEGNRYLL